MNRAVDQDHAAQPSAAFAEFPTGELVITTSYLILASLWIVFSDLGLDWLTGDPEESLRLQTYKGLNFVLTTSLLLYVVLRRSFNRRRRAEEQARMTAERFELVARAASDAIIDWNLQTQTLWWNEGFSRLFGFGAADTPCTIETLKERLHPEDRDRVLADIRQVAEAGGASWSGEYRFRRKDGSYAHVTDRGFLIRDAAGQPVRWVSGLADVTERRKAEEKVRQSQRQLRALSARLQSLREEERTRLAREIHDELGQLLTGLKIELRWLENQLSAPPGTGLAPGLLDRLVSASELADQTLVAVQKIAAELRPGVLDSLGLVSALEHEARRFQQQTGIRCTLQVPDREPSLVSAAQITIFRIFQEALTNVARHAGASEVEARLADADGASVLQVQDNGKGIDPAASNAAGSLGLLGMRERAELLDGNLTVTPIEPHGTRVELWLPASRTETTSGERT